MNNKTDIDEKSIAETLELNPEDSDKPLKRYLWIGIVIVFAIAIWFVFSGNERQQQRFATQAVTRGDLVVTVSATGTLAPLKEVEVGIEVSGTIKSVEADYNDRVTVGQVLARLDTTRLEAQALQSRSALEAARAKVRQNQASVQEAQAQMARLRQVRQLSGGKVPSQYDLDAAKATLSRAQADLAASMAEVNQAQATLNVNLTDIDKAMIRSPINGVVLERLVEPGQTVASQFQAPQLFTLAEDLTKMELQVDVDEADVGLVKPGQQAEFTVDAYPDRNFPAEITLVRYGSETVDGVVTYKTVLTVDNSALSLRPGMTATAVITVDKKNDVLLVANSALRFNPPETPEPAKSGSSFLDALLPHPPRTQSRHQRLQNDENKHSRQVWALRNGEMTPMTVTLGVTDGIHTEIVAGNVAVGTELVSGTVDRK